MQSQCTGHTDSCPVRTREKALARKRTVEIKYVPLNIQLTEYVPYTASTKKPRCLRRREQSLKSMFSSCLHRNQRHRNKGEGIPTPHRVDRSTGPSLSLKQRTTTSIRGTGCGTSHQGFEGATVLRRTCSLTRKVN